jgi:plastocyanin
MTMRRPLLALTALLTAAGLLVAGADAAPRTRAVRVGDAGFSATSIRLHRGDAIAFRWTGGTHNVTRVGGHAFRTIGDRSAGTVKRTFTRKGTYRLVCTIHEAYGMKITVTVSP